MNDLDEKNVKCWQDKIIIPTYKIGLPEKNPMFLEKRVYQGSSGAVYPLPVVERVFDHKENKLYKACFIENKYLKVVILPELGGRVYMAYDKVKQRHFVYYNRVIKPALVGLTGPWISGGIEFNWPQHHRPSTFQQIDYCFEENHDGSKTIWCGEIERMFRTKGMIGFTLYPDKAFLELKVKIYNRTNFPQSFLWWANPALKVNDEFQSVFPPDVNAVYDHGKRDVSQFPIAKGTYYKVDYSKGVDISWYKNIPVPTSYMAVQSKYDFVGGYEHDSKCGLMHIADHHISPGKKQWTWGTGDFGQAWYRQLTDEDGPYIELMTGVFTDNQPDFSWIMPFEERTFEQYFFPYSELGLVKNATKDALVNIELNEGKLLIKLFTTGFYSNAEVLLFLNNKLVFQKTIDISPEHPFLETIKTKKQKSLYGIEIKLLAENAKVLVDWQHQAPKPRTTPEAAKAVKPPTQIASIEQLFITGLHLEQYKHATYLATEYYLEALRRDPSDIRNNNSMGLWLLRHGQFAKAEPYFKAAIQTLTKLNSNPYDGESYFNLGWCLKMQSRLDEAYEAFFKSTWNSAWQDAAFLSLAQVATTWKRYDDALVFTEKSLIKNCRNHKTRHLRTAILRIKGETSNAFRLAEDSLSKDKFNLGGMFEEYLIFIKSSREKEANKILKRITDLFNRNAHTFIEYSLDYSSAGLYEEASEILRLSLVDEKKVYPMVYYLLGYLDNLMGNKEGSKDYFHKASELVPDYCFPSRMEEVLVLKTALDLNPVDANAAYYLGNYWYANQQYNEALFYWEKSANLNNRFPTVLRNLALIYYNKVKDRDKALELMEKAFDLDHSNSRILMELDQLFKKLGKETEYRLQFLEQYPDLVASRDDLYLEKITLLNQFSQYEKAKELLENHKFHPWEGGEGKVREQYTFCNISMSYNAFNEGEYELALKLLMSLEHLPTNLGEGKLQGTFENITYFFLGRTYEELSDQVNARIYFEKAGGNVNIGESSLPIYYNDNRLDRIFYQGLSLKKLGLVSKANSRFDRLIEIGQKQMHKNIHLDFFAVSFPDIVIWEDNLQLRNTVHCHYLIGLGLLGHGKLKNAVDHFNTVLDLDPNHIWTLFHLRSASRIVT